MTVFASQGKNLVFASPDGSNGQPDFRALTANDLPESAIITGSGLGSDITISSANRLLDTYLVSSNIIKANTLHPGSSFKISVVIKTNDFAYSHISLRFGPNANVLDTMVLHAAITPVNVANGSSTSDPGGSAVGPFVMYNLHMVVKSTGNSANVIGFTDFSLQQNDFSPGYAAETIVDTTVDNYLGVSYYKSNAFGAATGDAVVESITIQQLV